MLKGNYGEKKEKKINEDTLIPLTTLYNVYV